VLVWVQREFGLQRREVARACRHSPGLLNLRQATLEANWRAFEAEFRPTADARRKLAALLRQGESGFLILKLDTLRHKVGQLQELFHLDSSDVPRYIGHLAALFRSDIEQTVKPRFEFLQQLTGLPPAALVMPVLQTTLLRLTPDTLQRKFAAVEAALGPQGAQQLVRARPDALIGVEGRAALNISSLQQLFGCPAATCVDILLRNPRLAKLDMQSDAAAAKMHARVAFWLQAYGLPAAEAAAKCAEMLHRSLCTVGPRVAFFQQQRPGQPLPAISAFTASDDSFCRKLKLDPLEFEAFKTQWLASEEGRAVCAREGKQSERQPGAA
jgi:hypothetical protein